MTMNGAHKAGRCCDGKVAEAEVMPVDRALGEDALMADEASISQAIGPAAAVVAAYLFTLMGYVMMG